MKRQGNCYYQKLPWGEIQYGLISGRITWWFRGRAYNIRKPRYGNFKLLEEQRQKQFNEATVQYFNKLTAHLKAIDYALAASIARGLKDVEEGRVQRLDHITDEDNDDH